MRIIHFSDLHAGGFFSFLSGILDKRLFGFLNHLLRRRRFHQWEYVKKLIELISREKPEIIICTGDLSSISDPQEFRYVVDSLQTLWTESSWFFCFVPGNHDYYVTDQRCYQALEHTFFILNQKRWHLQDLPMIYTFKGCCFLLFNQAHPSPLYSANGYLSLSTVTWLQHYGLKNEKHLLRILVGHYPIRDAKGNELAPHRRCLNNSVLTEAWDQGYFQLSLCGHIHQAFIRRDPTGIEVCAGSLTRFGSYAFIEIDDQQGKINPQIRYLTL